MQQGIEKLAGKVAVITGGASGIGACTARLFCQHGAKVVVADVQDQLGGSVCAELGAAYVHCDVTDESQVSRAVDFAVNNFGRLDIMYNNAGIAGPWAQSIVDTSKEDFNRVVAVNLMGTFLGIKHAARVMVPVRRGCIISTSTAATLVGGSSSYPYATSKHGIVGLTLNAAVELGRHGIRVNCVSPAGVATPMTTELLQMSSDDIEAMLEAKGNLKGVILKAEDIAKAALFLASDDAAKHISGHNLVVDGGFTIVNPNFDMFKS